MFERSSRNYCLEWHKEKEVTKTLRRQPNKQPYAFKQRSVEIHFNNSVKKNGKRGEKCSFVSGVTLMYRVQAGNI